MTLRALASPFAAVFLGLTLASCAGRPPVLVPPSAGVEALEGHGSASIQGSEMSLEGRFSFLFRRPGQGRVDVSGPLGTTAYFLLFAGEAARFVIPSKKAYAEESPTGLMDRFLGFALRPDEVLRLLGGQWPEGGEEGNAGPGAAWALVRDGRGRVVRGARDGFSFEVTEFFPGAGVPRSIHFARGGSSGRMKILSLRFNPADRPEAFGTSFMKKYRRLTWEEMQDLLKNER